MPDLSGISPLFSEICDLKRVRVAHRPGSFMESSFIRSWRRIISGENVREVAVSEAAGCVVAARLGGVDREVLTRGGLSGEQVEEVLLRSFDAVSRAIPGAVKEVLRVAATQERSTEPGSESPGFVGALARQPRAGCTRPGQARIVLEPPESHAEHCQTVAVFGVIAGGFFGAEPGDAFLAGLAHHLHNAAMPDSGFTGEMMVGDHLETVMERFVAEALSELPDNIAGEVRRVLALIGKADNPVGKAFNAADVMDRVLQMRHYDRQAAFTLDQALEEMNLVHDGPVKDFHEAVLKSSGVGEV